MARAVLDVAHVLALVPGDEGLTFRAPRPDKNSGLFLCDLHVLFLGRREARQGGAEDGRDHGAARGVLLL